MRKTLLFIALCMCFFQILHAQVSLSVVGYPLTLPTGWVLGSTPTGAAAVVDSEIRLTTAAGTESGHLYYNTAENVTACGQFQVNFDFKIVASSTGAADGIAFFFINPLTGFVDGGGLGLPSPLTGLVLTLDPYDNDADGLNPESELFGYSTPTVYAEGSTAPPRLAPVYGPQSFIDDGSWHHVKITYNGGTVKVYFNNSATASITGTFPITTSGYFGFSASTGAVYSTQYIKNIYITSNTVSPINGADSLCVGSAITLNDSTSGGTWASSASSVASISSTGVLSGLAGGAATISYSYGSGCSATYSVTVSPDAVPSAVTAGISPAPACVGSPLTLTGAATGAASYSWTGPGGFTSTLQNPAITATEAGGGTYVFTAYNAALCPTSATASVTVSYPVTPFVTPVSDSICNGGVVMLTASVTPSLVNLFPVESWENGVPTTAATVVDGWRYIGATSDYWFQELGTSTANPATGTAEAGSYVAEFNSFDIGSGGASICSPSFSMTGVTGATLSFWVYREHGGFYTSTTYNTEGITVYANTTVAAGGTTLGFVPRNTAVTTTGSLTGTATPGASGWYQYTVPVSATGGTNYIVFKGTSKDGDNCYLDNVQLTGYELEGAPVWSPYTYLYSNAGLTTPYTGAASDTVYSNPTGITATTVETYTASVTNDSGCTASNVSNIIVYDPNATISGTGIICNGGSTNIIFAGSPGATVSYNINGGGTLTAVVGSTGTVTVPTGTLYASTTYYLTGVVSGLCSATFDDSAVVTVNAPLHNIFGDSTVCAGLTTTLSGSPTGGTWNIPLSGSPVASVTAAGGVVYGIGSGSTGITYTAPTTGCLSTTTITVNPSPAPVTGPAAVCAGSAITLSNAPTTGGSWSATPTSYATIDPVSGILTGESPGITVVTYTLPPGGCTATYTVTVNALPTAITGVDSVCAGLTTALGSTPLGGTWSSSSLPTGTVSGSGAVTGISSGTFTVTYTLSTGCSTDTTILVNPSPSPITGPAAVCVASSITLSDLPTTGGSWSTSPTSYATIDGSLGILTGASAGVTVVTYTLPPGGCTATYPVTVNALPSAITGPAAVCLGLSIPLNSTPGGGTWSTGPAGTASIDPSLGILTGLMAGTVNVTYTLGTGCGTTTTETVNPLPAPVAGNSSAVCAGLTVIFTDDSLGGVWSSSPASIATIDPSTGVLTGGSAGSATVTYTIPTGCIETTTVTVNPLPAPVTGASAVCLGLTTTLSDATGTGTWSSSNATVATIDGLGNVTGTGVGLDTVTYTLGTGCIETTSITVNPLPLPITGASAVCVNASIVMNDLSAPGTWSTSPASLATINTVNGTLTGVSAGTVTVIYTLPTSCMTSTEVTVNPVPDPIGGTLAVCEDGGTTTLTETTIPGTWSISPGSEATIDPVTGVVTGISAGPATVVYTLPVTGCFIAEAFTVNPLPSPVTGTPTVCVASSVTLHDIGGGTWTVSPLTIATVNSATGSVTGVSAGTATVTYTLGTGCDVTYTMTVDPQPLSLITAIGDTMLCQGGFVDLTANTDTGLSYQWYNGAGAILGAVTSTYTDSTAGTYRVRVTNGYGCSLLSTPMAVTVNSVNATISSTSGATVTCAGTGLLLQANTGTGISYQWQLNGVSIAGAVSDSYSITDSSGSYTVLESNSAGCTGISNSITVTVNPAPPGTITASGVLTFCSGGSVTLTGDSGYSYQWYGAAAGAIAGANGISYTATGSDTYWIEETNTYGCSIASSGITVNVIPLPDATITPTTGEPTTFCSGGSVTLNVATATGGIYQWYDNGVAITGATTSSYTDTGSGQFTAVISDATGCSATTSPATIVTVVPEPLIEPLTATTFCWGGSVTLGVNVVSATGGIGYQWANNGVNITGATNAVYNASTPGEYTCQVIIPGSCASATTSLTVTENPLPDPLISWDGAHLNTGSYYVTYQWYQNTISITGATGSTITPTAAGNYAVAVTDTNGCQSVSDLFVLTAADLAGLGLSVGTVTAADIKIYPNPAQTVVHISSPAAVRAQLTSIDGRALLTQDNATDIDISNIADGLYIIMIYDSNGQLLKIEKLVKTGK